VDEEGAEVFDEEDGAPGDLGTWRVVSWEVGGGRGGEGRGSIPRSFTWMVTPS